MGRVFAVLLAAGLLAACSGEPPVTTGSPSIPPPPDVKRTYPDPPPDVAAEVTALVEQWVADRSDEDGVYDIPPRGGRDVAGSLAEVHAVSQKDADTYTVFADFTNGEDTYSVQFFIDRTEEGLQVRNGFLHKVNGEVVSG
jgi:hypothetical protein